MARWCLRWRQRLTGWRDERVAGQFDVKDSSYRNMTFQADMRLPEIPA